MNIRTLAACPRLFAGALLVLSLLATKSWAQSPHYSYLSTGTFGSAGTWSDNANAMTLNSTDDEYSTRFTAFENVTVDRGWQSFVGMEAGTTIQVGTMADNGSGSPSGTYLASGTLAFTTSGNFLTNVNFSSSVSLSSGSVYHLVTRVPAIVGDFIVRFGGGEQIRPYDRAVDTNMQHVLRRFNGGAWGTLSGNPFFALGNGSSVVAAPGQPYDSTSPSQFSTTGGTGTAAGEQFRIFDKEVPAGLWVAVKDLNIAVGAVGGPTANLLLRFRETNGTILATATVPPLLADGTVRTIRLDQQIELEQGEPYLLTAEFGGASTLSHIYRFSGLTATSAGVALGPASWGGTNFAFAIRSGAANNWATYSFDTARPNTDISFSFQGIVVPEPSAIALLGLGSLLMLRRRFCR